ncbi:MULTISPECIES: MaoC family dehydratase [Halorussus]|uniref:MaoC family dehydratase n=1 Tax=Halorussus TaxID=1070314 RepID=UPI0020A076E7|nr:MaoC family dehydratase [Halorussus vallis]USZ75303.1 MaoC family dehydratase [Halorussus vallis]
MEQTQGTNGTRATPFSDSWTAPFQGFTTAWTRALELSFTAAANANRAALATIPNGIPEVPPERDEASSPKFDDSVEPAPVDSLTYVRSDWELERTVDAREELAVGDSVEFSKTVTDDDVLSFADASGDTNRLHLDDAYAEGTRFGGRIVHGGLVAGLVSAALAALPGTVVYLSQELSFLGPAHVGDRLTATCRIVERLDGDRYRLSVAVRNPDGETIVEGDATVMVDPSPERPADADESTSAGTE